jgi:hypothetical protein
MTVATISRRKRRIAADEAHSWARNLRLGNAHAKYVLCMLTLYVNGEGVCFVSIPQLSDDCELAGETIRRRLAWLEEIGAIARRAQWIDDSGRRNSDGRGRRTSDEIVLLLEADCDDIEGRASGHGGLSDPVSQTGSGDDTKIAQPSVSPPTGTPLAPSLRTGPESSEPEPEPEDSPLPPSGGPRDEGWEDFKQAWIEPMSRPSIAFAEYQKLTPPLQERVPRAANGYWAWHKAQGKKAPTPISAQTFLREIDGWPSWETYAQQKAERHPELFFVAEGSEDWRARLVLYHIAGSAMPPARNCDEGRGAKFSKSLTPALLSLAVFADSDPTTWPIKKKGSQQCGAWRSFLCIDPREYVTGRTRKEFLPGQWTDNWPIKESGLRVPPTPDGFPPRKDGSLGSTTGPPGTLMNDKDLNDLDQLGKMTG